jgi:signal transduction histidine kinase
MLKRTTASAPAHPGRNFDRRSLVGRLVWLAAVWSMIVLVGMGIALTAVFNQAAISRFDDDVTDLAKTVYAEVEVGPSGQITPPAFVDERSQEAYQGKYWQIADLPGGSHPRALARSRSLWDAVLNAPAGVLARLRGKPGVYIPYDTIGPAQDGHEPLRAVALLAYLPGYAAPVIFMAAENRASLNRDEHRFALYTSIALLLLGAGVAALVVLQVRVGLGPLFNMGREIADVRRGRAQRLTQPYPREIAPLAEELNALLDFNQEVVERQRTHVGNLAHALKTPISVLLAEAQSHPGFLADVVARQSLAMREQVEHHLRRARAAARAQTSGERTQVAPVLDEIARTLERIFSEKGVTIDWDADDDLHFLGERQDLQELAGNVMENACKWCRSRIWVSAQDAGDDRLQLCIDDDGPGLLPEQRDEVLKRGARLDESAPGSGLGLSIVHELARAYGGKLALSQSRHGGLRIDLELPRAHS